MDEIRGIAATIFYMLAIVFEKEKKWKNAAILIFLK